MASKEAFTKAAMFGVYTRRFFNTLFKPRLLLFTNTAIGGGIMWLADLSQQQADYSFKLVKPPEFQYDWKRSETMFKCGLAYGVVGHYWYKFLDWKFVGNTIKILAKKLSCELLAGPFFGLGMFLAVGYGEGKPRQESFLDFVDNLENLIMADLFFYIPFQYYNFNVVPPKYRFLFVGLITYVYDHFLSYIIHKSEYRQRQPYFRFFTFLKNKAREGSEERAGILVVAHKDMTDQEMMIARAKPLIPFERRPKKEE